MRKEIVFYGYNGKSIDYSWATEVIKSIYPDTTISELPKRLKTFLEEELGEGYWSEEVIYES